MEDGAPAGGGRCPLRALTHRIDLWVWQGDVNFNAVGQALTYLSIVFSLWSAGIYFRGFFQMLARRSGAADA